MWGLDIRMEGQGAAPASWLLLSLGVRGVSLGAHGALCPSVGVQGGQSGPVPWLRGGRQRCRCAVLSHRRPFRRSNPGSEADAQAVPVGS